MSRVTPIVDYPILQDAYEICRCCCVSMSMWTVHWQAFRLGFSVFGISRKGSCPGSRHGASPEASRESPLRFQEPAVNFEAPLNGLSKGNGNHTTVAQQEVSFFFNGPCFPRWFNQPILPRRIPMVDCYWVGSLDFGNKGVFHRT